MIKYVRSVPLHRRLRRIAIVLSILAVPHIAVVMATDIPAAAVNAHLVATAGLFILAKLESLAQDRRDNARALTRLTDAARR